MVFGGQGALLYDPKRRAPGGDSPGRSRYTQGGKRDGPGVGGVEWSLLFPRSWPEKLSFRPLRALLLRGAVLCREDPSLAISATRTFCILQICCLKADLLCSVGEHEAISTSFFLGCEGAVDVLLQFRTLFDR